jgi:hypothetical protein
MEFGVHKKKIAKIKNKKGFHYRYKTAFLANLSRFSNKSFFNATNSEIYYIFPYDNSNEQSSGSSHRCKQRGNLE